MFHSDQKEPFTLGEPWKDAQFEQRVQGAFMRVPFLGGVHTSVRVQKVTPLLADKLYSVDCEVNAHIRVCALVYDSGQECMLWLEAGALIGLVAQPMLQQYTADHPWIAGV